MKKSFAVSLFLAFLGAIGMNALVNAQQQTGVGQNQNVVTGSDDQFIGDMFRQRQNEGVLGTSSVNPLHQMVAYNDYRTVDMADDPGAVVPPSPMSVLHKLWNLLRAPFVLARGDRERGREAGEEGEMGDSAQAWIGLSFTDNGKDWYTGLHPGHPFDNSNLAPVLRVGPDGRGYQAASDPVMATTADKFFVGGIAFTPGPGGNSVGFVSRFVDRNDTEIGRNIQYEWTKALVVAPTGFFVDKPNIAAGPDGHVYVAFVVFDQNDPQRLSSKIYFYRSSDYGLTWSTTPVILSDPLTRNQSPWILVDPNNENTVYVGWRVFANRAGGIANAIVGRKSTNGGASFIPSTPYTVASQLESLRYAAGHIAAVAAHSAIECVPDGHHRRQRRHSRGHSGIRQSEQRHAPRPDNADYQWRPAHHRDELVRRRCDLDVAQGGGLRCRIRHAVHAGADRRRRAWHLVPGKLRTTAFARHARVLRRASGERRHETGDERVRHRRQQAIRRAHRHRTGVPARFRQPPGVQPVGADVAVFVERGQTARDSKDCRLRLHGREPRLLDVLRRQLRVHRRLHPSGAARSVRAHARRLAVDDVERGRPGEAAGAGRSRGLGRCARRQAADHSRRAGARHRPDLHRQPAVGELPGAWPRQAAVDVSERRSERSEHLQCRIRVRRAVRSRAGNLPHAATSRARIRCMWRIAPGRSDCSG